jgi:hypothetical protein
MNTYKDYFNNIKRKKLNINKYLDPETEYLETAMINGLCNKILFTSGLLLYSKKNNVKIVEPRFTASRGLGRGCHLGDSEDTYNYFSEIFDIERFNENLEILNLSIIPKKAIEEYNEKNEDKIVTIKVDHTEMEAEANLIYYYPIIEHLKQLKSTEEINNLEKNFLLKTLQSLFLIEDYKSLITTLLTNVCKPVEDNESWFNYDAIHMRVENEWPAFWGKVDENKIVDMYKNSTFYNRSIPLWFATAEKHSKISMLFDSIGINSFTLNNILKEKIYDTQSAISFVICLFSNTFTGSCPYPNKKGSGCSTFSLYIFLYRILILNNNSNYYYDENGIHPVTKDILWKFLDYV